MEQLQFLLGLALVLGFITMLLIDQCGGGHSHNHSTTGEGRERKRGKERDNNIIHTLTCIYVVLYMYMYTYNGFKFQSLHCKPRSLPITCMQVYVYIIGLCIL